ncbi:MAG: hypothetical protein FJX74_10705 [Armatimonadetes bacterium]|nr:hypothetical protein [Armatimonadota bacterium]
MDIATLRRETLAFVEGCRFPADEPGCYRYSVSSTQATLYSSCYAAALRSLYGHPMADERDPWVAYLNAFQDEDGLYRDPVTFDQGWYAGDPLWCGRSHLTCHVIVALTALGAVAPRPFTWLAPFADLDRLSAWLESRDFGARVAWTGNEIMNVGTLLQYARDRHNDDRAGRAVARLLDWLDTHHLNPDTGVWGSLDVHDPRQRSHMVQAAYHWWPLYGYDRRPAPHLEQAIDTVLATQNPLGGFGWGLHNPDAPHASSACEDIDSIDPLARLRQHTAHRREEVEGALTRAVAWVLANRTEDGGFAFIRDRRFEYGHPEFTAERGVGGLFPTWFRTLSLALIGKALPNSAVGGYDWAFLECPGYQFWRSTVM